MIDFDDDDDDMPNIYMDEEDLQKKTPSFTNDPKEEILARAKLGKNEAIPSLYYIDARGLTKHVALHHVRKTGRNLEYLPEEFRADKEIVLEAVSTFGDSLKYASDELQADKDVVLVAAVNSPGSIHLAPPHLQTDLHFLKEVLLQSPNTYAALSDELKNNIELANVAFKADGRTIEYAPDKIRDDKELARLAIAQNGNAFALVSTRLKNDPELAIEAVSHLLARPNTLSHASNELRNSKTVVVAAIMKDSASLAYASEELRNDKSIVAIAIGANRDWTTCPLQFAGPDVKNNHEVVLFAANEHHKKFTSAFSRTQNIPNQVVQSMGSSLLHELGENLTIPQLEKAIFRKRLDEKLPQKTAVTKKSKL